MGDDFDSGKGAGEEAGFDPEIGGTERTVKKPQKKRFKETTQRLRGGKDTHVGHRASLDWRHDARRVCELDGDASIAPPVEDLIASLMTSRTGESLLTGPGTEGLQIRYDMQNPGSQYYPAQHIITLNPYRTKGDLINLLVRELRRVWQKANGALVNPLVFEPDEAILVNRAQAADALMISIRVAWEMKLSGEQDAWNHIAGSPMSDVGRTFEVKARDDFRTLNNGEASRAAYDKFFEDSRTKMHDKRLIHQMLLDENGYMRRVADKRAGKGTSPRISVDLFKRLGELPEGRNYLTMRGARVPTDASYAAVEDRSNANFLWFIKFERSFHEKEMQMLEESVKLSAEIIDFAKWSLRGRGGEGEAGL